MFQDYHSFIARKAIRAPLVGIEGASLPDALSPFQRQLVAWALRLGRAAIFADTGLGKSFQQLSWARAVANHTGRRVIILTPLAVAQQTVGEAQKFGIGSVAYASDQSCVSTDIVVTNYDRIEKFDMDEFVGIVLDESSIIKAHDSKTRATLIALCRDMPFKLCCTATPAPNDYVELGNHAEFLGILSQKEMLATWFVHDGSIRATNSSNHGSKPVADWRLKGHAEHDFWAWVASWAAMVKHPRDLGDDTPGYDLPPLIKKQITVPVEYAPSINTGMLFPMEARTLQERIGAKRESIGARCANAAELVNTNTDRPWLIWCNLNDEASTLAKLIPGSVDVRGSDDRDVKAERLLGFARGDIRVLISKPSIAGFGMNFQRCADMVFVGLNDSFEQLYQAIRRCWRFGQTRPVTAYMIASETEGAVVANLEEKEAAARRMSDAMLIHMRGLTARAPEPTRITPHNKIMKVPTWIKAT